MSKPADIIEAENRGLEKAAAWHDGQAKALREEAKLYTKNAHRHYALDRAVEHEISARKIRTMKGTPHD